MTAKVFSLIGAPLTLLFALVVLNGCADETQVEALPASVLNALYGHEANTAFDDGSANGWAMTGLWHVSTKRPASGAYSAWFGDETTGDFSPITDAACPTYAAPCSLGEMKRQINLNGIVTLNFDYYLDGECTLGTTVAACNYDALTVEISTDGGASWLDLTGGTLTDTYNEGTFTGTYQAVALDLSAYTNTTVYLRFYFTSKDSAGNTGLGALIDNIVFLK